MFQKLKFALLILTFTFGLSSGYAGDYEADLAKQAEEIEKRLVKAVQSGDDQQIAQEFDSLVPRVVGDPNMAHYKLVQNVAKAVVLGCFSSSASALELLSAYVGKELTEVADDLLKTANVHCKDELLLEVIAQIKKKQTYKYLADYLMQRQEKEARAIVRKVKIPNTQGLVKLYPPGYYAACATPAKSILPMLKLLSEAKISLEGSAWGADHIALGCAISYGSLDAVKFLIEREGFLAEYPGEDEKRQPAYKAVAAFENPEILKYLYAKGARATESQLAAAREAFEFSKTLKKTYSDFEMPKKQAILALVEEKLAKQKKR